MSAARLLTGRPMHEPADKLDPEAGSLIWESDKGPMGVDVRIWRELSGDLDVWVTSIGKNGMWNRSVKPTT